MLTGGLFATLYGASFALYEVFPYVGEGARIIYERKLEFLAQNKIFPSDARRKVAVFGNSKVLSGFIPDLFDSLCAGKVYSFNLGLPDANRFIPVLEELIATGNVPTDIIITSPWLDPPEKNQLVFVDNDRELVRQLVPFREFPRDFVIFMYRSRYRGGVLALYDETKILSDKVLADRGYHFIAGQSLYPDSTLPEDYSLNADRPDDYMVRDVSFKGSAFVRLRRILGEHAIRAFIAPTYFRIHEYKSDPGPNIQLRSGVANYSNIQVLGEDYLSLPNHLFSDPVHANREGARFYTMMLWELIRTYVEDDESP
jgi:hypothetical protein